MKKLSSYQKLKKKLEDTERRLTNDIMALMGEYGEYEKQCVKLGWRLNIDLDKQMRLGDATSKTKTKGFWEFMVDGVSADKT